MPHKGHSLYKLLPKPENGRTKPRGSKYSDKESEKYRCNEPKSLQNELKRCHYLIFKNGRKLRKLSKTNKMFYQVHLRIGLNNIKTIESTRKHSGKTKTKTLNHLAASDTLCLPKMSTPRLSYIGLKKPSTNWINHQVMRNVTATGKRTTLDIIKINKHS